MAPILAAVMPAPRVPVVLREFPEPALEPGSVLLRTLYSEVCGTDVHLWHGRLAGVPYPIIPGHVSVGIADRLVNGGEPGHDAGAVIAELEAFAPGLLAVDDWQELHAELAGEQQAVAGMFEG